MAMATHGDSSTVGPGGLIVGYRSHLWWPLSSCFGVFSLWKQQDANRSCSSSLLCLQGKHLCWFYIQTVYTLKVSWLMPGCYFYWNPWCSSYKWGILKDQIGEGFHTPYSSLLVLDLMTWVIFFLFLGWHGPCWTDRLSRTKRLKGEQITELCELLYFHGRAEDYSDPPVGDGDGSERKGGCWDACPSSQPQDCRAQHPAGGLQ